MLFVGIFFGLFLAGSLANRGGGHGTAMLLWLAGGSMLLVSAVVHELRRGLRGAVWTGAAVLAFGLGVSPHLADRLASSPGAASEAVATTAVIVFSTALYGALTAESRRDDWLRPVSLVLFGSAMLAWLAVCSQPEASFVWNLALGALTGALIVAYFHSLRGGSEVDAVWLATSIFVGVFTIFFARAQLVRR